MKFGASTFIWVSPFSNKTLDLMKKVKNIGFDIIEICIEDPNTIDTSAINQGLKEVGIKALVCGAFGPDRDVSSEDSQIRKQGMEYIKKCVDFAVELGSPVVSGPMYSAVGKTRLLPPDKRQQQWNLAVDSLKRVGEYAAERKIKLAIEPLNRFETDFINTVEQGLELLERVNLGNVGFLLDTFHMNIEEKNTPEAIRMAGDKIFNFHACANDRGTPGKDNLQWNEIVAALKDVKYDNAVVIESFTTEITEIAKAVSLWRPLASSQDALAIEGLAFLKKVFS